MGTAAGLIGIFAMYAALVGGVAWIGVRARRQRAGGNVLGAFDEIWHPAGYRHRIEVERHDERVEAPPAPGDPPSLRSTGVEGVRVFDVRADAPPSTPAEVRRALDDT